VAALCWRRSGRGLRILLITSRDTGRWVIPKGWPMRHRTEAEAAAREAYEEAGLRGTVSSRSLGVYTYLKTLGAGRVLPCVVRVYPLEAQEMLQIFPETGQRRAKWFDPEKAARRVAEHELAAMIRDFDPEPEPA
jgi:8-oxo-dGTP pyrophosphatase MutT (NUDIX family)